MEHLILSPRTWWEKLEYGGTDIILWGVGGLWIGGSANILSPPLMLWYILLRSLFFFLDGYHDSGRKSGWCAAELCLCQVVSHPSLDGSHCLLSFPPLILYYYHCHPPLFSLLCPQFFGLLQLGIYNVMFSTKRFVKVIFVFRITTGGFD